jgi:hypothetical protein
MKRWATATAGPMAPERNTGQLVDTAAREALTRHNGGLPPNLHLASRLVLLRVIRQLHEENKRLRAGLPS